MPSFTVGLPRTQGGRARWICMSCMMLPDDHEAASSHIFQEKTYSKLKACVVCQQLIATDGSVCRVCRLTCHKDCERKEGDGSEHQMQDGLPIAVSPPCVLRR
ncbi:tensin-1-like isoform X2 [Narcine bancroftii]|uniref:tensin-1-like isoform X2 n=1 Tax=Narcine bancroftii TaxID=1343680 RepID=UPI003831F9DC